MHTETKRVFREYQNRSCKDSVFLRKLRTTNKHLLVCRDTRQYRGASSYLIDLVENQVICNYSKWFNKLKQLVSQVLSPLEVHDVNNSAGFLSKTKHACMQHRKHTGISQSENIVCQALLYLYLLLNFLIFSSSQNETHVVKARNCQGEQGAAVPKLPFWVFLSHSFTSRGLNESLQIWNKCFVEDLVQRNPSIIAELHMAKS